MRSWIPDPPGWQPWLKIFRADRPELAARGARAHTFSAGLEQAEQLWRASATVDAIASPILLFYGLTQCGRAICAGGVSDKNGWRGLERHGLEFELERPPGAANIDMDNVWIKPSGRGLVHQVADILGSPVLARRASLAELICSLDVNHYFDFNDLSYLSPVNVNQYDNWHDQRYPEGSARFDIGPIPDSWKERTTVTDTAPDRKSTEIIRPSIAEVREWLSRYERLAALGDPSPDYSIQPDVASIDADGATSYSLSAVWQLKADDPRDFVDDLLEIVYHKSVARRSVSGAAAPSVAGNAKANHVLITWWLVL